MSLFTQNFLRKKLEEENAQMDENIFEPFVRKFAPPVPPKQRERQQLQPLPPKHEPQRFERVEALLNSQEAEPERERLKPYNEVFPDRTLNNGINPPTVENPNKLLPRDQVFPNSPQIDNTQATYKLLPYNQPKSHLEQKAEKQSEWRTYFEKLKAEEEAKQAALQPNQNLNTWGKFLSNPENLASLNLDNTRPRLVPPVQIQSDQQIQQPTEYRFPVPTIEGVQKLKEQQSTNENPPTDTRSRWIPNAPVNLVNSKGEVGDQIDLSRQKIDELSNKDNPNYQPVINKDRGKWGRVKDILRETAIGAAQGLNQTGSLEGALGGALGGGLTGGFHPQANEERERLRDIQQEQQRLGFLTEQQKNDADIAYKRGQTENLYQDNEFQRERLLLQREQREEQQRQSALNTLFKAKYFDPKNAAHRAQAAKAGLNPDELGAWDDRNPYTKQVAGRTYQYNHKTGAFEPTNLPEDESKTLTDYEVTLPNGETRTYKVAQGDAARFAMQAQMLGVSIQKANSQITGQNSDDDKKYQDDLNKYEASKSGVDLEIAGVNDKMETLSNLNKGYKGELATLNKIIDKERIRQINAEIAKNDTEFANLKAELGKLESKKRSLVPPTRPTPRATIQDPNKQTPRKYSKAKDPLNLYQ